MAKIFVTGSTQGIGRKAGERLIEEGHDVVLHARNAQSAATLGELGEKASAVLTGDLSSLAETRDLAEELNAIGQMDAIIHNAGIIDDKRVVTGENFLRVLMVNAVAPFALSMLVTRPKRLVFTGSSVHRGHDYILKDLTWDLRAWSGHNAYGESKLLDVTLALALARRWPSVVCSAVDPGWVPTRMGGPSASDDLTKGHVTQCWLATSSGTEATLSGQYWRHLRREEPDPKARDTVFQDRVLERFADMTGVSLS